MWLSGIFTASLESSPSQTSVAQLLRTLVAKCHLGVWRPSATLDLGGPVHGRTPEASQMRRSLFPRRGDGDPSLARWPRLAGEPLSWEIQSRGNVTVVLAEGELDVGTAPRLAGQLGPLADEGCHLVLDMSGVRFCDCAGLSLFLRLKKHAAAAGGSLH